MLKHLARVWKTRWAIIKKTIRDLRGNPLRLIAPNPISQFKWVRFCSSWALLQQIQHKSTGQFIFGLTAPQRSQTPESILDCSRVDTQHTGLSSPSLLVGLTTRYFVLCFHHLFKTNQPFGELLEQSARSETLHAEISEISVFSIS